MADDIKQTKATKVKLPEVNKAIDTNQTAEQLLAAPTSYLTADAPVLPKEGDDSLYNALKSIDIDTDKNNAKLYDPKGLSYQDRLDEQILKAKKDASSSKFTSTLIDSIAKFLNASNAMKAGVAPGKVDTGLAERNADVDSDLNATMNLIGNKGKRLDAKRNALLDQTKNNEQASKLLELGSSIGINKDTLAKFNNDPQMLQNAINSIGAYNNQNAERNLRQQQIELKYPLNNPESKADVAKVLEKVTNGESLTAEDLQKLPTELQKKAIDTNNINKKRNDKKEYDDSAAKRLEDKKMSEHRVVWKTSDKNAITAAEQNLIQLREMLTGKDKNKYQAGKLKEIGTMFGVNDAKAAKFLNDDIKSMYQSIIDPTLELIKGTKGSISDKEMDLFLQGIYNPYMSPELNVKNLDRKINLLRSKTTHFDNLYKDEPSTTNTLPLTANQAPPIDNDVQQFMKANPSINATQAAAIIQDRKNRGK